MSRWITLVGITAALSGCDQAEQEDLTSLRCLEFEDDLDDGGEPEPAAIVDEPRGGINIGCQECGSHWTIVEEGRRREIVVHIEKRLWQGVSDLNETGEWFYGRGYGQVFTRNANPDADGYSVPVVKRWVYTGEAPEPVLLHQRNAVLRFRHEHGLVDIELQYVNNKTHMFEDPPFR